MIIYEAPHKLRATLKDLLLNFGEGRRISLCREITKLNEEVQRMTLGEANAHYSEQEPRGEYVLIVEGAPCGESEQTNPLCALTPEEHVEHYVASGERRMDAIKHAAKDRGMTKSELYKLVNND
jgi:16S rRNA (cytidine1402-2'-O)-methyltransferase